MNNEVVRISQIKLSYNETKKCIVAKVVTSFENGLKQEKTISKMDTISEMLDSFAKQEGLTITELMERGLILIDEAKLKDREVIIRSDDGYNKIVYDYDKNAFVEKRLTREDRRALGLFTDSEVESIKETKEEVKTPIEPSKDDGPVTDLIGIAEFVEALRKLNPDVEIRLGDKDSDPRYYSRIFASIAPWALILPEGFAYDEEAGIIVSEHNRYFSIDVERLSKDKAITEPSKEDKPVTDLMDFDKFVEELRKLNPDVEIMVGNKETDPRYYSRIFASVAPWALKLPEGFEYNEKNGITNKHHTEDGRYVCIDVEPLVKEDIVSDSIKEDVDGSVDAIITGDDSSRVISEDPEKDKKGIKFLKYAARALAVAAAGYIIIKSGIFSFKGDGSKKQQDGDNRTIPESNIEDSNLETTPTTAEPEEISQEYFGEAEEEDIDVRMQQVNDLCSSYEPCSLYTLVSMSDRNPIEVITMYRNKVLINEYNIIDLLDQYVGYIFEGKTMFGDHVIKAYDYLSPYARYIVLVSAQTMLELCTDYNYSTIYNGDIRAYYYENLTEFFNDHVDSVTRELLGNGKKY